MTPMKFATNYSMNMACLCGTRTNSGDLDRLDLGREANSVLEGSIVRAVGIAEVAEMAGPIETFEVAEIAGLIETLEVAGIADLVIVSRETLDPMVTTTSLHPMLVQMLLPCPNPKFTAGLLNVCVPK
jgi:hypothetical protein